MRTDLPTGAGPRSNKLAVLFDDDAGRGKRMRTIASWATAMVLLLAPPAFADLVSRYAVAGRNSNGTSYTGTIAFKPAGQVYHLDFTGGDGGKFSGLAIEYKNFLALAVIASDRSGNLAIYKRAGDAWIGLFSDYEEHNLGTEAFYNENAPDLPDPKQPKSGRPAGMYVISGTNPDGSTYRGEGEVTPWSAAFDVRRTIGKEETTGTAVAFDGALAMNVAQEGDTRAKIGVLGLLIPDGNGFLGVWSRPGSQRLGAERWVRK